MGWKAKKNLTAVVIQCIMIIGAVIMITPFIWMLLTAVKTKSESISVNPFYIFPGGSWHFENFVQVWNSYNFLILYKNTLLMIALRVLCACLTATLAGYAFARLKFRGKNLLFSLFLALMMIPNELVVITNFVTITNWNMRNTFWGLILPSVTSVFYIYLLKENFEQIPEELYKAAKVDGTSDLKYLFKVMLPICRPTVVTVIILKVIECWNSYVWPRLITDEAAYFLVSNGIQELRENGFGRENVPAMMAAVVVISVPLIVLFLIFRNKIMEGVSRGGTKG
jgi:multiple sugar transport system permease protein